MAASVSPAALGFCRGSLFGAFGARREVADIVEAVCVFLCLGKEKSSVGAECEGDRHSVESDEVVEQGSGLMVPEFDGAIG